MNLRAVTYNIQSGRDCFMHNDICHAASALRDLKPDICALNEVRMRTSDIHFAEQARQLGEMLNMNWTFAKAVEYNQGDYGIALLSRFPILSADTYRVEDIDATERTGFFESRVILRCVLNVGGREVCALTSHFGLSNAERVNATALALRLLRAETRPCLFMGDLNMPPDDKLIKQIGTSIRDCAQEREFLTHRADKLKCKIDYIFASSEFKVIDTYAPLTYASDHLPVVAELTL